MIRPIMPKKASDLLKEKGYVKQKMGDGYVYLSDGQRRKDEKFAKQTSSFDLNEQVRIWKNELDDANATLMAITKQSSHANYSDKEQSKARIADAKVQRSRMDKAIAQLKKLHVSVVPGTLHTSSIQYRNDK